jgi:hypothetical protein
VNLNSLNGFHGSLSNSAAPFQPRKNDEGLMGAIIGILPTILGRQLKKISQQIVRVKRTQVLRFQHASSLEFGKAFQFITGKSAKKVHYIVSL